MNDLCQCGCGQKTKIAPYSSKRIGWIKGHPTQYILGHNMRGKTRIHSKKHREKISNTLKKIYAKSENTPSWKGGLIIISNRYFVKVRNHPYKRNYYIQRVRLIVECVLGRSLKPSEVVHHIDGNTLNDKKGNLLLCSDSYHKYLHGKIRGGWNYARIQA